MNFQNALDAGAPPVVAILRGLTPDSAVAIGAALIEAGIRLIEVPLNSPDPLDSIERLVGAYRDQATIGAGTVLDPADVDRIADIGGEMIVSPNTNMAVIERTVARGLESLPGFMSPTEAHAAVAAGATRLKLFPATALGTAHLKAVREILPKHVDTWAVGGTGAANLAEWIAAGAGGIGVGGALFRPGDTAEQVGARARELVAAWRNIGH